MVTLSGRQDAATLAASLGKQDAVRALAQRAGLGAVGTYQTQVGDYLATIGHALGRLANHAVELRDGAGLPGASVRLVSGRHSRRLAAPLHLCGMPDCFTPSSPMAYSPDLDVLEIAGGYVCHYPDGPLIVSAAGDAIARDFSSPFAGLVHFYETPLRRILDDAVRINGTALVLADDVRPLNFCHWLVDWLPRLSVLGEQVRSADLFVVVPKLTAAYQWDTLQLAGIAPERVIQLGNMQALRADRLLATSDLHIVPHPGHKAAPWLTSWLRASLGYASFVQSADAPSRRRKLYVSRGDAEGRRVFDEAALMTALRPFGYQMVTLGTATIEQQIALFAGATHIVAPHGAGLTNIVFAQPETTLVEIFPRSYGTAAYYVLAAGLGIRYASYIADDIMPGSRAQLDDINLDAADFVLRCGHLL
jgi:capsular polysaccharide biosynthesis protein